MCLYFNHEKWYFDVCIQCSYFLRTLYIAIFQIPHYIQQQNPLQKMHFTKHRHPHTNILHMHTHVHMSVCLAVAAAAAAGHFNNIFTIHWQQYFIEIRRYSVFITYFWQCFCINSVHLPYSSMHCSPVWCFQLYYTALLDNVQARLKHVGHVLKLAACSHPQCTMSVV